MVGQKEIPTKRGEWPSTGDPPFTETLVQTVYLSLSKSLRLAHVDTIVTMRRLVFVVVVVLVVGGATWAQWPSTVWPRAFCAPVVRVVAADARAIVTYQTNNENLPITPAEHKMLPRFGRTLAWPWRSLLQRNSKWSCASITHG